MLQVPEIMDASSIPVIESKDLVVRLFTAAGERWSGRLTITPEQPIEAIDAMLRAIARRFELDLEVWFRARFTLQGFADGPASIKRQVLRQRSGRGRASDLTVFEIPNAMQQSCIGALRGHRYIDQTVVNQYPFAPGWGRSIPASMSLRSTDAFATLMKGVEQLTGVTTAVTVPKAQPKRLAVS